MCLSVVSLLSLSSFSSSRLFVGRSIREYTHVGQQHCQKAIRHVQCVDFSVLANPVLSMDDTTYALWPNLNTKKYHIGACKQKGENLAYVGTLCSKCFRPSAKLK